MVLVTGTHQAHGCLRSGRAPSPHLSRWKWSALALAHGWDQPKAPPTGCPRPGLLPSVLPREDKANKHGIVPSLGQLLYHTQGPHGDQAGSSSYPRGACRLAEREHLLIKGSEGR